MDLGIANEVIFGNHVTEVVFVARYVIIQSVLYLLTLGTPDFLFLEVLGVIDFKHLYIWHTLTLDRRCSGPATFLGFLCSTSLANAMFFIWLQYDFSTATQTFLWPLFYLEGTKLNWLDQPDGNCRFHIFCRDVFYYLIEGWNMDINPS